MKTIKYFFLSLLILPTVSLAAGKLECGKWREVTQGMGIERWCTFHGSSLDDAMQSYFKGDNFAPYRQLMLKNHEGTKFVKLNHEVIKISYYTRWESPTEVTINSCQYGTDACDGATFERKGNIIRIYGFGS